MNFKSKQQIYDYVGEFLIKQGRRSADDMGNCLYRGENDLRCAVGCILPDDKYKPEMEHGKVHGLVNFLVPWYIRRYLNFLRKFQIFHDTSYNWDENGLKVDRLIAFGKENKLDTSKFE